MFVNKQLASSKGCLQKDKWQTDPKVFKPLNDQYNFTLDPCCEIHTALCDKFYTEKENGLIQKWEGETVFVNPPYSRGNIDQWMKKCYEESLNGTTVIALIPVSTSSNWWHEYVWNKSKIHYFKGRLRFVGAPFTAPFSSCLAIYNAQMPFSLHER